MVRAEERWQARKALYELFGADPKLIAICSNCSEATINNKAAREYWKQPDGNSAARIALRQLHAQYSSQIQALTQSGDETVFDEKHARSLSVLAKTLETILTLDGKLSGGGADERQSDDLSSESPVDLNAEITRLVGNLEGKREAE
ncbi:MAG: hypothetical protein AAF468_21340 [Pseudomonadota bacterium]